MSRSEEADKVDEVANDLDELATSVDEMKETPASKARKVTIDKLADALEQAKDAADALEEDEP
jgi:hypothetical protein